MRVTIYIDSDSKSLLPQGLNGRADGIFPVRARITLLLHLGKRLSMCLRWFNVDFLSHLTWRSKAADQSSLTCKNPRRTGQLPALTWMLGRWWGRSCRCQHWLRTAPSHPGGSEALRSIQYARCQWWCCCTWKCQRWSSYHLLLAEEVLNIPQIPASLALASPGVLSQVKLRLPLESSHGACQHWLYCQDLQLSVWIYRLKSNVKKIKKKVRHCPVRWASGAQWAMTHFQLLLLVIMIFLNSGFFGEIKKKPKLKEENKWKNVTIK